MLYLPRDCFGCGRHFRIFVLHNMVMFLATKDKIVSMYIWICVRRERETDFERQRWVTLSEDVMIHSHYQQIDGFRYCNYMCRNSRVTYCIEWSTSWEATSPTVGQGSRRLFCGKQVALLCSQGLLVRPTLRQEGHIISHYLGKGHLNSTNLSTTSRFPNLSLPLLCRLKKKIVRVSVLSHLYVMYNPIHHFV